MAFRVMLEISGVVQYVPRKFEDENWQAVIDYPSNLACDMPSTLGC